MTVLDPDFPRALRAAQRGDLAAFAELWRIAGPRLDRYLRITAAEAVDEIASATWVTVATGLRSFAGGERAFHGVLARVARYVAARCSPGGADRAAVTHRPASASDVVALVGGLSPDVGEMLALRVVMGMAATETARLLGTRPGFAIVAVHGGLRRAALASDPTLGSVALPNPWQLDRLLDRIVCGEQGVAAALAVLHPAARRVVTSLVDPGRPGNPAQLAAAREAFRRSVKVSLAAGTTHLSLLTSQPAPFARPQPTF